MSAAFTALGTPSLILDGARLDRNIERLRSHLESLRVPLRPHVKTSKCIEVVRRAIAGQPGGITVSTLGEASWFFERGLRDIVYAVGIVPQRLPEAAALIARGCRLKVILDAPATARMVAEAGSSLSVRFPVLLELDSDGQRGGLQPGSAALFECARVINDSTGSELAGVLTHAGASYDCASTAEIRAMASKERAVAAESAALLREAGFPCPVVSVGSTPTATFAEDMSGVTEVRAGVYMFNDLIMAGLGVCAVEDIALSVLATVIGHQRHKGWILVDAGWMALSRDRGPASLPLNQGYGVVCDANDGAPVGDLIVVAVNQEHGVIASRDGQFTDISSIEVGTRLRILPIHACATAGMHDSYSVLNSEGEIVDTWPRMRGWKA
jgi:D-serine deaminase-like pyridoxal phosphate-dependent protein